MDRPRPVDRQELAGLDWLEQSRGCALGLHGAEETGLGKCSQLWEVQGVCTNKGGACMCALFSACPDIRPKDKRRVRHKGTQLANINNTVDYYSSPPDV